MSYRIAAFADEADEKIDSQIEAMRKNSIRLLEIRGVDGENVSDISLEKAREVRRKLDDAGMAVWSVGSPFGKIGIEDDFAPHLEKFKRCLDVSGALGANHIRLFSFYGTSGSKDFCARVMERLRAFVDAAYGSGIILCHENEKGIYGDVASRCLEIHRNVPEIRAVFDPANFVQCGQDTREAWNLLSPYVEYMHIKDALEDGRVVPAGKGTGNLPFLLENYKGEVLTVEPHLSVFKGFSNLEGESKTQIDGYTYPSSRDAFDAAVKALRDLIEKRG